MKNKEKAERQERNAFKEKRMKMINFEEKTENNLRMGENKMVESVRKREFKKLAKTARTRLKSGFWEDQRKLKQDGKMATLEEGIEEKIVRQYFSASLLQNNVKSEDELCDDRLYPIVCKIIDEDDGLNPIGRMIEREKYSKMENIEKQRYIFDLSERYARLSQKYLRECEAEKRLRKLTRM